MPLPCLLCLRAGLSGVEVIETADTYRHNELKTPIYCLAALWKWRWIHAREGRNKQFRIPWEDSVCCRYAAGGGELEARLDHLKTSNFWTYENNTWQMLVGWYHGPFLWFFIKYAITAARHLTQQRQAALAKSPFFYRGKEKSLIFQCVESLLEHLTLFR